MSDVKFTDLVEMQQVACERFASNPLFGTKRDGKWDWLSYGDFAKMVDDFRGALAARGVTAGDRVAVISNNRVEWAVGAFATFSLGAWYIPTYEATLPKEWKFILEDSGAKLVLAATDSIYETIKGFIGEVENLEGVIGFELADSHEDSFASALKVGSSSPAAPINPSEGDIACLIYTSGTTGKPKGVKLSHGNIVSNVNAVHDIFPMDREDRSLSFLPWAHSFGQTCELHCLMSMGAAIGIAEGVPQLIDNLAEVKPTLLFSVPRIFNRIYDGLQKRMAEESPVKRFLFEKGIDVASRRRQLEEEGKRSPLLDLQHRFFDKLVFSKVRERFGGQLKYAFSGGAALSKEVAEFIDDMGILVFEGYGLTETSPIATANRPGARKIGTIGKPIPEVEIYICDEHQQKLPVGKEGEIVVVGPNVMQGYYNRPEATEEVIFELDGKRAFRTGDMGRISNDGFVSIVGRFKEQYKLENGKYVSPAPLEEQLQLSGMIGQVCIYGFNKPYNVALIVPDFEALEKWAKEENIADTSIQALAKNPKVIKKYEEEIDRYGSEFKNYEKPRKVMLLTEEFSTDNEMLTPSLKLKRRNVIAAFEEQIEALYA